MTSPCCLHRFLYSHIYGILNAIRKSRTGVRLGKLPMVPRTLMRALWRVNLMLELNRSLLNREYTLMNILKPLASIISMCNLHATFLSKSTSRYFTLFTNGIFRPFNKPRQDKTQAVDDYERSRPPESYLNLFWYSSAHTRSPYVDCVGGPHLFTLAARRCADQLVMELRLWAVIG
jgi:hypothetical protein